MWRKVSSSITSGLIFKKSAEINRDTALLASGTDKKFEDLELGILYYCIFYVETRNQLKTNIEKKTCDKILTDIITMLIR